MQFLTPILFRVIRVLNRETYEGWLWLDGYELANSGDAVARREIFVQSRGLRMAVPTQPAAPARAPGGRRPTNAARLAPAAQTGDVFARRLATGQQQRTPQRNR